MVAKLVVEDIPKENLIKSDDIDISYWCVMFKDKITNSIFKLMLNNISPSSWVFVCLNAEGSKYQSSTANDCIKQAMANKQTLYTVSYKSMKIACSDMFDNIIGEE